MGEGVWANGPKTSPSTPGPHQRDICAPGSPGLPVGNWKCWVKSGPESAWGWEDKAREGHDFTMTGQQGTSSGYL